MLCLNHQLTPLNQVFPFRIHPCCTISNPTCKKNTNKQDFLWSSYFPMCLVFIMSKCSKIASPCLCFLTSCSLSSFLQSDFHPDPPLKLLLSRSTLASTLPNPTVHLQSSSYITSPKYFLLSCLSHWLPGWTLSSSPISDPWANPLVSPSTATFECEPSFPHAC